MRPIAWLVPLVLASAGCTSEPAHPGWNPASGGTPGSPAGTGPLQPTAAPPPPSNNVIDVAIWPRLIQDGTTQFTRASDGELCRRMSLDFRGIVPTPNEVNTLCVGKSPAEMAQSFLATPEFVARELRLWVQVLGENPMWIFAYQLKAADPIIENFATGVLGYDDFVARLLAHPVVAINRRIAADEITDISNMVFPQFLGRAPVGDEAADFANLFRVWRRAQVGDPQHYVGYRNNLAALDPTACQNPVLGATACTSTLLGPTTTINLPANPTGSGCYNYFNLVDRHGMIGPADGLLCYMPIAGSQAPALADANGNVPAKYETELEKPGRLLATRQEFWEQAGERALERLLGWWNSSLNQPDTILPEVRAALGAWFKGLAGHDIRQLYTMVVTSLLYTTTAEVDPSVSAQTQGVAPWLAGPTKAMTGEQYMDSAIRGLARTGALAESGPCDPHIGSDGANGDTLLYDYYYPAQLRVPSDVSANDFYRASAVLLGGCNGGVASAAQPGMRGMFAQVGIGQTLCDAKSVLVPSSFNASDTSAANVQALVTFQFRELMQRDPQPAEQNAALSLAQMYMASTGANTFAAFPSVLCQTLLRTGSFIYY